MISDIYEKSTRSAVMRRLKSQNTGAKQTVRKIVVTLGENRYTLEDPG